MWQTYLFYKLLPSFTDSLPEIASRIASIHGETFVNRLSSLICRIVFLEIVLLMSPSALLAQRGGRGAGAGAGRPPTGAANTTPNEVKDFDRAIALQATPDQVARFQQLTKSTEAARRDARDLLEHADSTKPESARYAQLNDAVGEAQSDNRKFVSSFSTPQQSGLKPLTKKLGKVDSDISKQSKAISQELGRSGLDAKKMAAVVEKLDKALTDFQIEQLDIGKEMGIQIQERSQ